MSWEWLDQRPLIVAIAGSNGAGKTTFYHAHVEPAGLHFVNADVIAKELTIDAYVAADIADAIRRELLRQRESFAFETVFSDPAGEKINFLKLAVSAGYTVVVCFVGLSDWSLSEERVAMRATQGGHDVPTDKLRERFPRTLANLKKAIAELPHLLIFDNSDLSRPYRLIATFENGTAAHLRKPLPEWLTAVASV